YGCALQKEILVQGRLYISENHVCFNANIFGWVTNLVIAFSEITSIDKRMTAFVIPNAISIVTTTNTRGHFFASFLSRDNAHDLLMAAWRKSFPCAANAPLPSSSNGGGYGHGVGGNHRQYKSHLGIQEDEDSNDGQSFISAKAKGSSSRKNRHRRSFSNASHNWTGDESQGNEGESWGEDGNNGAGVRRRGSKRTAVRKMFKDVIAPIIPDDDQRNGPSSPNSNSNRRSGRARSISELPPRPTSFGGAAGIRNRDSVNTMRSSLDDDSLAPNHMTPQRPRAGTESLPNPRPGPSVAKAGLEGSKLKISSTSSSSVAPLMAAPHAPTTCKCSKDGRHYATTFLSEAFPGTVEALWKLLFESDFTKSFLTSETMKGADVQEDNWKDSGNGTGILTKTTRYIKWLGLPIGPKTTKAVLTDVCESKNFDDYTTTVTTTSTPDVPSGGSFTTKVRTCITWSGSEKDPVLMVVTGGVEFTKSSWIKGQIEKGAAEGMTTHYKELSKAIRKHIAANPKAFGVGLIEAGGATSLGKGAVTNDTGPGAQTTTATAPANEQRSSRENRSQVPSALSNTDSGLVPEQNMNGSNTQSTKRQAAASSAVSSSPSALLSGFWPALSKAMEWNHGAVSHVALISVLVVVMAANIYIYFQISGVGSQIERIQSGTLQVESPYYPHYHHHRQHSRQSQRPSVAEMGYYYPSPGSRSSVRSSSAGSEETSSSSSSQQSRRMRAMDEFERDELFAREQEEAMWAWLTEREARHRQYRNSDGRFGWRDEPQEGATGAHAKSGSEKEKRYEDGLTEIELKLQARIESLQEQLAALERQTSAIKVEARISEQEQEQQ
ncbi:hypothetical protein EDD11_004462, partial [Mortierella claussenii]